MPFNKDGSRKTSPMYKKSGFKMKGSPMQRNFGAKPAPTKFIPAILAWLGGGAGAGVAAGMTATAAKAAAVTAGKAVVGKAAVGGLMASGSKKKSKPVDIMPNKQVDIMGSNRA